MSSGYEGQLCDAGAQTHSHDRAATVGYSERSFLVLLQSFYVKGFWILTPRGV